MNLSGLDVIAVGIISLAVLIGVKVLASAARDVSIAHATGENPRADRARRATTVVDLDDDRDLEEPDEFDGAPPRPTNGHTAPAGSHPTTFPRERWTGTDESAPR